MIETVEVDAHEAHAFWPHGDLAGRLLRVIEPRRPALVLGSTTREESFALSEARRAGYDVVRRASGGGAVLVAPGAQAWLMLYLPRRDPLVEEDLGASFLWIGEVVAEVLASVGVTASVVDRRLENPPVARDICFAGLGFGEVLVGGRKVLGLAQRRTRDIVAFQVSLLWQDLQPQLASWHRPPVDRDAVRSGGLDRTVGGRREELVAALVTALQAR